MAVERVERGVESYYRRISLSATQCDRVRRVVRDEAEARLKVAREQSEQHTRRLRALRDEQQKLLQLYYRGGVSEEVMMAEQSRIEMEHSQARKLVDAASHEAEDVFVALDEVLRLIGPDCHATYTASDAQARRLLNQAIFERLIVTPDDIDAEPHPLVADLHRLAEGPPLPKALRHPRKGQTRRSPRSLGGHGSHLATMVPRAGLEPAPPD
jgi:hypothetical protein